MLVQVAVFGVNACPGIAQFDSSCDASSVPVYDTNAEILAVVQLKVFSTNKFTLMVLVAKDVRTANLGVSKGLNGEIVVAIEAGATL
jgi:hypothetical protein